MKLRKVVRVCCLFLLAVCVREVRAQSTNGTINGRIADAQGRNVPGVEVRAINIDTNMSFKAQTNSDGLYYIPNIPPGRYRLLIHKEGFKEINKTDVALHVQDIIEQNFDLQLGAVSESVTVTGGGISINTTDASVSTVVDRQFVENIPLNGRSLQDLLTLAPGTSLVGSFGDGGYGSVGNRGEITVNGQRTEANNFFVDGVSANTGTAAMSGAGVSGSLPGQTVLGSTQSIVSIDALQEFRASTSTYSAEYGRTPGGQFSFSTRSGTNTWHGTAFNYFRNAVLDANNWFNKYAIPLVPRQAEKQNDFGGTLGGPIALPGVYNGKDKTFFFFSYEGLRLTVPQPYQQYFVPDLSLRQDVPAAIQPFLNAFPKPNGPEDGLNDGLAYLNVAYSSPSSLDNIGVRVDHSFSDKVKIFGRYASTPSSNWVYSSYDVPGTKYTTTSNVRTLTVGATSSITLTQANEFRFNITQNNFDGNRSLTNFGGATPFDLGLLVGPNGTTVKPLGAYVEFGFYFGGYPTWTISEYGNHQRQYNVTDTYTLSRGRHQLKFGMDWRRLVTYEEPTTDVQAAYFYSEASVLANSADLALVGSNTSQPVKPVYHNFSFFAQDEWKTTSRLSLSLGLRWDINPAPGNLTGPIPYTIDQIANLATTALAPENTPLWKTDWRGLAPRAGLAYQLRQEPGRETVLRTGFGIFYDTGNIVASEGFNGFIGYSSFAYLSGVSVPLTEAQVTLPPPSVAPPYDNTVWAFDPNLKLPYTMQWNLSMEQGLGGNQTLTVGYVASGGRKLLSNLLYDPPNNPNFSLGNGLYLTANRASSDYNSLQVKYQKSLSRGVQALGSYTWSHSIDDLSANFYVNGNLIRGSSDFDIRHNFQAAITYDVPGSYANSFASALLTHWGLDTRISARSALPIDVTGNRSPAPGTDSKNTFTQTSCPASRYISMARSIPEAAFLTTMHSIPLLRESKATFRGTTREGLELCRPT